MLNSKSSVFIAPKFIQYMVPVYTACMGALVGKFQRFLCVSVLGISRKMPRDNGKAVPAHI